MQIYLASFYLQLGSTNFNKIHKVHKKWRKLSIWLAYFIIPHYGIEIINKKFSEFLKKENLVLCLLLEKFANTTTTCSSCMPIAEGGIQ